MPYWFRTALLAPLICLSAGFAHAQPNWFWNPGACPEHSVGISTYSSVYPDSSAMRATIDAAFNRAITERVRVRGTAGYHRSPLGTYILFNEMQVSVDTSRSVEIASGMEPQAQFVVENAHLVLAGSGPCRVEDAAPARRGSARRANRSASREPDWVTSVPTDPAFLYALGYSDDQFYERSSWKSAEWNALYNLASFQQAGIYSEVSSADSYTEEFQFLDMDQTLRGVEVTGRYKDARRGLYYVLVRVPKQDRLRSDPE